MRPIFAPCAAILVGGGMILTASAATAQAPGPIVAPSTATTVGRMQSDAIHDNAAQALDKKKEEDRKKSQATGATGDRQAPATSSPAGTSGNK